MYGMVTGSVAGVIRVGDPDAVTGKVICGQPRRWPIPPKQQPPARREVRPRREARPTQARRRRPSRRARSPGRLSDDDSDPAEAVLRLVRPGLTATINLRDFQRVALSNPEGFVALSLLGHLLAVRYCLRLFGEFPFAPSFVERLSYRAGTPLGRNAARRVVRQLRDAGVIVLVGSYRGAYRVLQPSGFQVPMYRVAGAVHVRGRLPSSARPRRRPRSAKAKASVAGPPSVKGQGWWCHPLFGNPDGLPPPHVRDEVIQRWTSTAWLNEERHRENEFYGGPAT